MREIYLLRTIRAALTRSCMSLRMDFNVRPARYTAVAIKRATTSCSQGVAAEIHSVAEYAAPAANAASVAIRTKFAVNVRIGTPSMDFEIQNKDKGQDINVAIM